MTIDEMHKYFDVLADKHNAPYATPLDKDVFLNLAQDKLLLEYSRVAEANDEVQNILAHFTQSVIFRRGNPEWVSLPPQEVGTVAIRLSGLPDLFRVLRVMVQFDLQQDPHCPTNIPIQKRLVAKPTTHNAIGMQLRSPFHAPADQYPYYLLDEEGPTPRLVVITATEPTEVQLIYLRRPARIDSTTPTATPQWPEIYHPMIVERAVHEYVQTLYGQPQAT